MSHSLRILCLLALALAGCAQLLQASWEPQPDIRQAFAVPDAPAQAYTKAVHATMAVGGMLQGQDRTSGALSATVQQAILLNVTIAPTGQGSTVIVQSHVAPTHRITGPFTLVDDWVRAYHHQS